MKVQSIVFVLFLVAPSFATTPSQARIAPVQPQSELKAAQEAYQLGQETQQREAPLDIAYKNEHCSADALHWTFASANRIDQSAPSNEQRPVVDKKVSAVKVIDRRPDGKQFRSTE